MLLHQCVTILCRNCVSNVHLLSSFYIKMCFPYFIIGNQKWVQTSFRKVTGGKIITNSVINLIILVTLLLQIFKECWAMTLLRPLAAVVSLLCRSCGICGGHSGTRMDFSPSMWCIQVLRSPNLFKKKLLILGSWKCSHFSM